MSDGQKQPSTDYDEEQLEDTPPLSPTMEQPTPPQGVPRFIAYLVLLPFLLLVMFGNRTRSTHSSVKNYATHSPKYNHNCTLPNKRYDILTGYATCLPPTGGIWMSSIGPLELQHLNINRFASTERAAMAEDEGLFCHQLRQWGGSWYRPRTPDDLWTDDGCHDLSELAPEFAVRREVGFPAEGGVWVLTASAEGTFPEGMAMVRNALTMEERCWALEKLGARWCESVHQCSALNDLQKPPHKLTGRGYGGFWPWRKGVPGSVR